MASDSTSETTQIFAILHQWGVHSLGQLAALEREPLVLRLGPLAGRLWDQATGRSERLLRVVRPPEIFREEIAFEYQIETAEPLLFVLRRFLEQLALRLGALHFVTCELHFQLIFADKSNYTHRFQIPEPTIVVEILFRLLQTHLENFRAEHPIVAVALEMQPARAPRQQFDLFETPLRDPSRLHETLNRLTGLLGATRVGTPVLEDSHRPEAFHLVPFVWQRADLPNDSKVLFGPAWRRLRHAPREVAAHEIVMRQGPYLASGEWWDKKIWSRAEWDLELATGEFGRAQPREKHWQLEALYD